MKKKKCMCELDTNYVQVYACIEEAFQIYFILPQYVVAWDLNGSDPSPES